MAMILTLAENLKPETLNLKQKISHEFTNYCCYLCRKIREFVAITLTLAENLKLET